jgi:hypothetical protein
VCLNKIKKPQIALCSTYELQEIILIIIVMIMMMMMMIKNDAA